MVVGRGLGLKRDVGRRINGVDGEPWKTCGCSPCAVRACVSSSHAFCRTCLALEQERAISDSRERRVRAEGVSLVLLEMGRLEGRGRLTEAEEDHGEDKTRSAKLGGHSAQQRQASSARIFGGGCEGCGMRRTWCAEGRVRGGGGAGRRGLERRRPTNEWDGRREAREATSEWEAKCCGTTGDIP